MDVATFEQLLGPVGIAALTAARELGPTEAKYPAHYDRLRKHFSSDLARAALDTVMLRERARIKFARADDMFFTREALEMASAEPVARYRAGRFRPYAKVADLCCGIGGDAIGLATTGLSVFTVDRDPLRVRMTEANLAAYGLSARYACADALTVEMSDCAGAFADPSRRVGGRRTLSLQDSEPSVPALVHRFPTNFPLGVKVAPGFPKQEAVEFEAETEFISLNGELKECTLWFGPLRSVATQATVLPGPHTLTGDVTAIAEVAPVGAYLYDPDPSVTRAGLVGELGRRLSAWQLDSQLAFLTSDVLTQSPFASAYRVEEVLPVHERRLGAWLKTHGIGRVTVVKRGSTVDADELVSKWKLSGDYHRAVILTRSAGRPVAIVGVRLEKEPGEPLGPPGRGS
jgi:hypothetical protein